MSIPTPLRHRIITSVNNLHFARLEVYQLALEAYVACDRVASRLPHHRRYLADQLRRAALSIPLNIAEGAGEFAPAEKSRFYRYARRSTNESSAALDAAQKTGDVEESEIEHPQSLLEQVVPMLTRMIQNCSTRARR
jgi:four helix bundle protein